MPVYLTPPPQTPLARALAAIVSALLLVGAFMIGMVAFLVMLGVGLLAGAWLWFRTWRLRRSLDAAAPMASSRRAESGAIEGEYTVVTREEDPRS